MSGNFKLLQTLHSIKKIIIGTLDTPNNVIWINGIMYIAHNNSFICIKCMIIKRETT